MWLTLMDALPAITFLAILKSIARYPDLSARRKDIAVFIIGTLTSFTIGLAFGIGFKFIIDSIN
jgi:hypothetical protein